MEATPLHPPSPQEETLLIVDDDPLITNLFQLSMTRRNFRVLVAPNGTDALRLLDTEGNGVDMVITDMTMPDMDGLEVARELNTRLPNLPVVIATGLDMNTSQGNLPPNVVDVVRKPFQMRALAERLHTLLDSRKA